jgi:putative flippase GtrA
VPTATRERAGDLSHQLRSFAAIGIACTAAFALLYAGLRDAGVSALAANALALASTMGINFWANRRVTFDAGGGDLARQLAGYAVAYLLGLAASTVALLALDELLADPHGALDAMAAVAAGVVATAVRFVLMRAWVFADRPRAA